MPVRVLARPKQGHLAAQTAHVFAAQVAQVVKKPPGDMRLEQVHAGHDTDLTPGVMPG